MDYQWRTPYSDDRSENATKCLQAKASNNSCGKCHKNICKAHLCWLEPCTADHPLCLPCLTSHKSNKHVCKGCGEKGGEDNRCNIGSCNMTHMYCEKCWTYHLGRHKNGISAYYPTSAPSFSDQGYEETRSASCGICSIKRYSPQDLFYNSLCEQYQCERSSGMLSTWCETSSMVFHCECYSNASSKTQQVKQCPNAACKKPSHVCSSCLSALGGYILHDHSELASCLDYLDNFEESLKVDKCDVCLLECVKADSCWSRPCQGRARFCVACLQAHNGAHKNNPNKQTHVGFETADYRELLLATTEEMQMQVANEEDMPILKNVGRCYKCDQRNVLFDCCGNIQCANYMSIVCSACFLSIHCPDTKTLEAIVKEEKEVPELQAQIECEYCKWSTANIDWPEFERQQASMQADLDQLCLTVAELHQNQR